MVKKYIYVNFQKEGIHCYPAAGELLELADVSFLQYPHRHLFHFKVTIEVIHDDREIEFILFKRWLESLYSDGVLELNHNSCEMMATNLFSQIESKYPNREVCIDVSEDGENGAIIKFNT